VEGEERLPAGSFDAAGTGCLGAKPAQLHLPCHPSKIQTQRRSHPRAQRIYAPIGRLRVERIKVRAWIKEEAYDTSFALEYIKMNGKLAASRETGN
jgi:hypothetical protein